MVPFTMGVPYWLYSRLLIKRTKCNPHVGVCVSLPRLPPPHHLWAVVAGSLNLDTEACGTFRNFTT